MRDTLGVSLLPLVDVILVLLAAFMVAAPMIQQGTSVELPEAGNVTRIAPEALVVTVPISYATCRRNHGTEEGCMVEFGRESVEINDLADKLREELASRPTAVVHLRGHREISYGHLVEVIDQLRMGDAQGFELVLERLHDDSSDGSR